MLTPFFQRTEFKYYFLNKNLAYMSGPQEAFFWEERGGLSKNVGRQKAADTGKQLSLFTNFPANMFLFGVRICFCLVSEKAFALPHILTPKNYFLEAL